jgi:hypothetical protein
MSPPISDQHPPVTIGMAYIPPQARGKAQPNRQRSLSERYTTSTKKGAHYNHQLIDGRTKQESHLFDSIVASIKDNNGGPAQFAGAVVANYIDQCTAFTHVNFHETHLNSYLGLCAWWVQCAVYNTCPNTAAPLEFARDPVVRKAYLHVFGPTAAYNADLLSIPDTISIATLTDLHSAFSMLTMYLRSDAAALKHNAVLPTSVPSEWIASIRAGKLQPELNVILESEHIDAIYTDRLNKLQERFTKIPIDLETHAIIVQRLCQKSRMQYCKLSTARILLR